MSANLAGEDDAKALKDVINMFYFQYFTKCMDMCQQLEKGKKDFVFNVKISDVFKYTVKHGN